MFSVRIKIYGLIFFSLIIVSLVLGIYYWPKNYLDIKELHDYDGRIKISKYLELNKIPLPEKLQQYLLTKEGSILNVIYYDGNKLIAHDSFDWDYFSVLYLKAMRKLAQSPHYTFKPGYYLFSFLDGVHTAYEWPVLGFAAIKELVKESKVVLIPDPDAMQGYEKTFAAIDNNIKLYTWQDKIDKIFWRGVANGIKYDSTDIVGAPRLKFLNVSANFSFVDAGLTGHAFLINDAFRQKLIDTYQLKEQRLPAESIRYKYLIDIDGKSCSWSRMAWILYSDSVLLKHQSDNVQWYYDKLKPYVHYVPIAKDFSNLKTQYEWLINHDKEAASIAENGRAIAKEIFNEEAILKALEKSFIQYNAIINAKLSG